MPIFKKLPKKAALSSPPKRYGLLIVDDEPDILAAMADMLAQTYRVQTAANGQEALKLIGEAPSDCFQVIIADQRMPSMTGVELLEKSRALLPRARRIVLTGYSDFHAAVDAINNSRVSYFMLKPFEKEELLSTIAQALEEYEIASGKSKRLKMDGMYGSRFRAFLEGFDEVPASNANVLIHGETGTGKELVARFIHENSARRERPFVTVHCAALPETLFETELFGYRKGAFTGAGSDRKGRVALAHGGTLFIDEVAEIPLPVQAKLLRFFQSGEYQQVGSDQVAAVDVRIVTATHRDLRQMVEAGAFREDLYYRLKVVEMEVPPLRERSGDLAELLDAFLKKFGKGNKTISRQALAVFQGYNFPGNVRELENAIERAYALASIDEIGPHHLPREILEHYGKNRPKERRKAREFHFVELTNEALKAARDKASREVTDRVERAFLNELMETCETVAQAARDSGMARPYLHRLLTRHGMHWSSSL